MLATRFHPESTLKKKFHMTGNRALFILQTSDPKPCRTGLDICKKGTTQSKSSTAPNHAVLDSAFYFFLSRRRNPLKISLEGLEHNRHSWTTTKLYMKKHGKGRFCKAQSKVWPNITERELRWWEAIQSLKCEQNDLPQQNANIPHSMIPCGYFVGLKLTSLACWT